MHLLPALTLLTCVHCPLCRYLGTGVTIKDSHSELQPMLHYTHEALQPVHAAMGSSCEAALRAGASFEGFLTASAEMTVFGAVGRSSSSFPSSFESSDALAAAGGDALAAAAAAAAGAASTCMAKRM